MLIDNYLGYTLIGYYRGSGVYHHPDRPGLSIERDHYLVGMTDEEIAMWKSQQYDLALTQRLEEERERAAQIAEDWCAEIGHGLSSGRPHMPTVDGMVI